MPNTTWPDWRWAYLYIWGVTALSTGIIYWLLKRKKWM
jgi:Mg2+ and Co2+ transporter CorA